MKYYLELIRGLALGFEIYKLEHMVYVGDGRHTTGVIPIVRIDTHYVMFLLFVKFTVANTKDYGVISN